MNILNPSKGVNYYAFIAKNDFKIKFKVPSDLGFSHDTISFSSKDNPEIQSGDIEISESNIGLLSHTGRFEWNVYDSDGKSVLNKYIDIAPYTGNVGDTNIEETLDENAVFGDDYTVSYGFYDASSGHFSSLTNHDQSYVYVTKNLENWMGSLIKENDKYGNCPLNTFALAGSHDTGMYTADEAMQIIDSNQYTNFISQLSNDKLESYHIDLTQEQIVNLKEDIKTLQNVIKNHGVDILVNLAMTQKDGITAQLRLGIRYFDIRPGFCAYADDFVRPTTVKDALDSDINNLYHQHKLVPGRNIDHLISTIIEWLQDNPTEIIVVSLNFQGFLFTEMKPTPDFLNQYIAKLNDKSGIKLGNKSDLNTSYNNLIKDNKRLIFLNQIGESADAAKYDSYTKTAYETTDVTKIIGALNAMSSDVQKNGDYTVLQLQATANALISNDFDSSFTFNHRSSPLMSTKAMFDAKTYTWIYENVLDNFDKDQLIVFLNDFSDNALANQSMIISKNRMDKYLAKKG